jgi:hypothetical protein
MYYNNNQRFLQKHLSKKIIRDMKIFEKTEIKWFSFEDIQRNKSNFRNFYQNIVDLILKNKKNIKKFLNKGRKNTKKIKVIGKRKTRKTN